MKHSLKNQLFLSVLSLLLFVIGANFLVNNFFLEHYYLSQKSHTLESIYADLDSVDNDLYYQTEEFETYFQQISDNSNLNIVILKYYPSGQLRTIYETRESKIMRGRLEGYLYGLNSDNLSTKFLKKTANYMIEKCSDYSAENEFLECFGYFDNGCIFLMRSSLQSIRESAEISNRFSAFFLLIGLVIAVLITWIISGKITKPVKELTNLSERMANLDFDAKYAGKMNNEIGILGENFNHLSTQLEQTISELKSANNELLNDLEERTKIEEMRKEFLSNVTHELKTPIALIQGYAEGLTECINDDESSRDFYCEVIMDEAAKMNHMVKMMLSLNHLESGSDMVSVERFDLIAMMNAIVLSSGVLAEQKETKIQCMFDDTPVYVWADEYKIEEVFTNYISNAIHYVNQKGEIKVSLEKKERTVRVNVYNSGSHIPESEINNVWIKFYKVDKARTREYGGSGIGLSIVKAIMDLHHQDYGVKNEEDGVLFWFELDAQNTGERV